MIGISDNKNLIKINHFKWIFASIFFGAFLFLSVFNGVVQNQNRQYKKFQDKFLQYDALTDSILYSFVEYSKSKTYEELFENKSNLNELQQKFSLSFFITEKNIVKFWSNNEIEPELNNYSLIQFQNAGVFLVKNCFDANREYYVYGLLKRDFKRNNNFISDYLNPFFDVGTNQIEFSRDEVPNPFLPILNTYEKPQFYIKINKTKEPGAINIFLILFFISYTIILFIIQDQLKPQNAKLLILKSILFLTIVLILRLLMLHYRWPYHIYNTHLFTSEIYASSYLFRSLGDLLLNVISLFIFSLGLHNDNIQPFSFSRKKGLLVIVFLINYLWFVSFTIAGLIENSRIPFDFDNITEINIYTLYAIAAIALLNFSSFFVFEKLYRLFQLEKINSNQFLYFVSIPLITLTLILLILSYNAGSLLILMFTFWYLRSKYRQSRYNFFHIILIVAYFSIVNTYILIKYSQLKIDKNYRNISEKLSLENDPLTEYLLEETEFKLLKDKWLNQHTIEKEPEKISAYLNENYFTGYLSKYHIDIEICENDTQRNSSFCSSLNEKLAIGEVEALTGSKLFFKNKYFSNNEYFMLFPINKSLLYGHLYTKREENTFGYPILLLSNIEIEESNFFKSFIFAKYKNNKLLYSNNSLIFPVSIDENENFSIKEKDEYYFIQIQGIDNSIIIIGKPKIQLITVFTLFSYLFIIFGLIVFIFSFISNFPNGFQALQTIKGKVQLSLVATLVLALFISGIGSFFYIKNQYELKYKNVVNDKLKSLVKEFEEKFESESKIHIDSKFYLEHQLQKYAQIFFNDIHLYDINGNLIASSRKEIFRQGIANHYMQPSAYYELKYRKKLSHYQNEYLGNIEYLSAYSALRNGNNEVLGYINLPYFTRQNELNEEIASFLTPLVNIYMFIFLLFIVLSVFLANLITKPLQLIQSKLKTINITKSNDLIVWPTQDEIGDLVFQYNQLVKELEENIKKLAESERNLAWKEMAKQIAHEIKNPLTPIKLSFQLLEKSWHNQDADFSERLKRFSSTLTEQIESLSQIASAFSAFAKMPEPQAETFQLKSFLEIAVESFKGIENLTLEIDCDDQIKLFADRKLFLRVINNLLQNAIQAIPENKKGVIQITAMLKKEKVVISIKDNGTGIQNEIRDKIFQPNFTTKSSGMGLGLAMVKNIIEQSKGTIYFDSELGIGTTFYIEV